MAVTPQQKPVQAPAVQKFTRKKVDPNKEPFKFLIYGVEGIGKSTLASSMPKAVFIPVENPRLKVESYDQPKTLEQVYGILDQLANDPEGAETVVIDTLDALEGLIWRSISARNGWSSIEDAGFGKGYNVALEEWRQFLVRCERVWARGMNVVFVAHSMVRAYQNPEGDNFDRYTMKLFETKEAKPGAMIRGWCDAVLFVNYETVLVKDKKKVTKAKETGARLIHTEWRAAFDAKNRFNLPPTIPLSWDDLNAAITEGKRFPLVAVQGSISEKLAQVGDTEIKAKAQAAFDAAGEDLDKLERIDNRLSVILAEQPAV